MSEIDARYSWRLPLEMEIEALRPGVKAVSVSPIVGVGNAPFANILVEWDDGTRAQCQCALPAGEEILAELPAILASIYDRPELREGL